MLSLSETDFRARVNAGDWPSQLCHGTIDGRYDYAIVRVLWPDGTELAYAWEETEARPLDGSPGRCAFDLANRILADHTRARLRAK